MPTIHNIDDLARLAGSAVPLRAGVDFLRRVEASALELLADPGFLDLGPEAPSDAVFERARDLVPAHYGTRWEAFADLGAWDEDVSDFGPVDPGPEGLSTAAGHALYRIAARLLVALTTGGPAARLAPGGAESGSWH